MELPEAAVLRLLDTWPVAVLATLGRDGGPAAVPVVFARHAERLFTPVDGKPKRSAVPARVRNVRRDPRVALLLERYDPDWRRLWWIRVDGEAAVLGEGEDDGFEDAAGALRRKYPQYASTPLFAGDPTLLRVDPVRVRSWCAGPEALA